jgi:hypothetical protein
MEKSFSSLLPKFWRHLLHAKRPFLPPIRRGAPAFPADAHLSGWMGPSRSFKLGEPISLFQTPLAPPESALQKLFVLCPNRLEAHNAWSKNGTHFCPSRL